ncbi:hypothetical protein OCD85_27385 [Bacillus pacificus]|uniref:hypothetical protein n=1 Tax=Bacillus pacificus TaxID=2026187 RepID=UPI0021CDE5B2|nr:hypothetical protein [Bacillus pacificus]MCU5364636.1 hypothetical protein [Bacillus pacificus]MCU5402884.1 hypothetical protein [Bacillus pacificus]
MGVFSLIDAGEYTIEQLIRSKRIGKNPIQIYNGTKESKMVWFDEPKILRDFEDQVEYYFGWIPDMMDNRSRYLYKGWKFDGIDYQTKEDIVIFQEAGFDYKTLIRDISKQTNGKIDQYLVPNVLSFPTTRKVSTLREIQFLYSDIDDYKVIDGGYTYEQIMEVINKLVEEKKMPRPTALLKAHGWQPLWKHSPIPFFREFEWKKMQSLILSELKSIGADPAATDAVRYLRANNSIHGGTNERVKMYVFTDDFYSFDDLYKTYIRPTERPKPHKKKEYKKAGKITQGNYPLWRKFKWGSPQQIRSLHITRLMDLEKLVLELRGGCITGNREYVCFLYRYWHLCSHGDEKSAICAMLDFYHSFATVNVPYSDHDLIRRTNSAETAWNNWLKDSKDGYNYSNEKLIEVFDITPEEQKEMETIIGDKEHQFRNTKYVTQKRRNNGVKERAEYEMGKQEKIEAITNALKENPKAKNKEIAEVTGIKFETVKSYAKSIRKSLEITRNSK